MIDTDRPYPFFSVNADKFIAREGEFDVEYNLGRCWIAYNDILALYGAAADVVDGGGDREMSKLRDVVIKVNGDFKKTGLLIDEKEIMTKKPRWKCDRPGDYDERHAREWMERHPHGWYNSESDYGTGDEDNETTASDDSAAPCGGLHPAGVAGTGKADQVVEGKRHGQTVQA